MDARKFNEKAVKAESAFNIDRRHEYLDPGYCVEFLTIAKVTPTGHLEILRLEPISSLDLPSFSFRWDQKENTIDIDLIGEPGQTKAFKLETGGYQGHHPKTLSNDPRVFKIDIRIPGRKVYEGQVTLNVGIGVVLREKFHFTDSASCQVTPKPK